MYVCGWRQAPVIFSLFLLAACGGNGTLSSDLLPAPNGQYVQASSDYAYAMAVYTPNGTGICSGTRVAQDKILTASHCAESTGTFTVRNAYFFATGAQVVRLGNGEVGDPTDLAIITLSSISRDDAPDSMQRIAKIGSAALLGEKLRLTGVGCDDVVTKEGVGQMRTGENLVYDVEDLITFVSPFNSVHRVAGSNNRASSCAGDSGGGWVRQTASGDEVVAVVHAGGSNGSSQESLAVDTSRQENVAFFKANGVDVP